MMSNLPGPIARNILGAKKKTGSSKSMVPITLLACKCKFKVRLYEDDYEIMLHCQAMATWQHPFVLILP